MDYRKLPYDDAAPLREMAADCAQVDRLLRVGRARTARTARIPRHRAGGPTSPSGRRDLATPPVSKELAATAARLELHLG